MDERPISRSYYFFYRTSSNTLPGPDAETYVSWTLDIGRRLLGLSGTHTKKENLQDGGFSDGSGGGSGGAAAAVYTRRLGSGPGDDLQNPASSAASGPRPGDDVFVASLGSAMQVGFFN